MKCDVSDEQSVKAMVYETAKLFGTIDVLINNAAYFMTVWKGPFWEMAAEEFDKAMAVNVRGSWLCAKAAFPYMKQQGKGKIINISSGTARATTCLVKRFATASTRFTAGHSEAVCHQTGEVSSRPSWTIWAGAGSW